MSYGDAGTVLSAPFTLSFQVTVFVSENNGLTICQQVHVGVRKECREGSGQGFKGPSYHGQPIVCTLL